MKKEEFVALGISEDLAKKAAAASTEELKGYVPMSRFNEVNEAKKTAEGTIKERDKQLETLKKSAGDVDAMKKQIEDLQNANKTAATEHEKALKALRREGIDNSLLSEAGAKNAKAVIALMDAVADDVDDEGYKTLRLKQIEAVKKDNDYLFNQKNPTPNVAGASPIPSADGTPDAKRTGYETKLAEARKSGSTAAVLAVKREAAGEGIFLM